jgi:outer membrane protein assembly factor BamB
VIAALGVRRGDVRWIKRYDRAKTGDLAELATHFDRDLTPCVYHQGVLFCAPSDTPYLFALDAVTGQTIWANNLAEDAIHLLGVGEGRLIVSGDRVCWFDANSGKLLARWPEGPDAGIHGYGRGVLAGDAVLWPTREQKIFVFDVRSAQQVREAIDLRPLDVRAGHLLVGRERLLIAGAEEIVALGPPPPFPLQRAENAEVAAR